MQDNERCPVFVTTSGYIRCKLSQVNWCSSCCSDGAILSCTWLLPIRPCVVDHISIARNIILRCMYVYMVDAHLLVPRYRFHSSGKPRLYQACVQICIFHTQANDVGGQTFVHIFHMKKISLPMLPHAQLSWWISQYKPEKIPLSMATGFRIARLTGENSNH